MAIRLSQIGNKAGKISATVRNDEASVAIPKGTPVVLNISTTDSADDGLSVVLPATAGSANSFGLKYGVASDAIANKQYGESILFGKCAFALVTRATRAATTDSWTSSASQASGAVMQGLDTINNAFLTAASSAATLASAAPCGYLLDSIAVLTASASATTDARTAIVTGYRSFVRMM